MWPHAVFFIKPLSPKLIFHAPVAGLQGTAKGWTLVKSLSNNFAKTEGFHQKPLFCNNETSVLVITRIYVSLTLAVITSTMMGMCLESAVYAFMHKLEGVVWCIRYAYIHAETCWTWLFTTSLRSHWVRVCHLKPWHRITSLIHWISSLNSITVHAHAHAHANFITPTRNHCPIGACKGYLKS